MIYDVLYLDHGKRQCVVAQGLGRDAACDLAREEARKRHVGRMFLAGSEQTEHSDVVVIVESQRRAA